MPLSFYIHKNPLRAGMVKRLIDYRWSSYRAYAYNRRHAKWLIKISSCLKLMEQISTVKSQIKPHFSTAK
jgi:hypothetical protein